MISFCTSKVHDILNVSMTKATDRTSPKPEENNKTMKCRNTQIDKFIPTFLRSYMEIVLLYVMENVLKFSLKFK